MWPYALLIAAGILVFIYWYCDKMEKFIFIKLLGYSLLGGLILRLNGFVIPLGLLIFLGLFKPSVNRAAKIRAVCLGFILLLLFPLASEWYFERPVKVAASSTNVYLLDFSQDWRNVQEKIGLQNLKLEDFEVSYEADGEIRGLSYSLKGYLDDDFVWYQVKYMPGKQAYSIEAKKIDIVAQHSSFLPAKSFFHTLEKINLQEVVDQQELAWYVASCDGMYMSSMLRNSTHFLMEGDQVTLIEGAESSVSGFSIALYGMKLITKTATAEEYVSSNNWTYYWFQR